MDPSRAYKAHLAPSAQQEPLGQNLDISNDGPLSQGGTAGRGGHYLSVLFSCCSAYCRIYKTSNGTAYAGACPKCCRPVRIAIGPDGTSDRTFIAV
jgi:hypothetical protein